MQDYILLMEHFKLRFQQLVLHLETVPYLEQFAQKCTLHRDYTGEILGYNGGFYPFQLIFFFPSPAGKLGCWGRGDTTGETLG